MIQNSYAEWLRVLERPFHEEARKSSRQHVCENAQYPVIPLAGQVHANPGKGVNREEIPLMS